nr:hypothetical protein BgiMline_004252 [Biomphalaria glabrata]
MSLPSERVLPVQSQDRGGGLAVRLASFTFEKNNNTTEITTAKSQKVIGHVDSSQEELMTHITENPWDLVVPTNDRMPMDQTEGGVFMTFAVLSSTGSQMISS